MSLLHVDRTPVRGFPHAARERAAASRFRQRGTLHAAHVNTRHIPDPAVPLDDDAIEQLYTRQAAEACTDVGARDEPWTGDDYPRLSPFGGDTDGSAQATRRFWIGVAVIVVVASYAIAWLATSPQVTP